MSKQEYSFFERFFHKVPGPIVMDQIILFLLVWGSFGVIAYTVGEIGTFLADITLLVLTAGFAALLWGEVWTGTNIRKTLKRISENYDVSESFYIDNVSSIMSYKQRLAIGTICGIGLPVVLYIFGFWYTSTLLTYAGYCIAAFFGFVAGEMVIGTVLAMRGAIRVGQEIESQISLLDSGKIGALKDLAGWGLQISVIGSIIGAVILPVLVNAPWANHTIPTAEIVFVGLFAIITLMLLAFFIPTEGIHQTMVNIKDRMEDKLSAIYMSLYEEIDQIYEAGRIRDLAVQAQGIPTLLGAIDMMQKRVEEAPTWPFDVGQIRSLFGTILIPIGAYILQNLSLILTFLGLG